MPELVKNLSDDFEERLKHIPSPTDQEAFLAEVISLLAWFQNRFVWIHPFNDYNGRVARLLTNLLALNLGLPVLEIQAETDADRTAYIEAMKQADQQNYTSLEDLIAKALREKLSSI